MRTPRFILPLLLLTTLVGCSKGDEALMAKSRRVFGTIDSKGAPAADSPALVSLGRTLYFSPQLSLNRTQSCNSCHPVDGGKMGADGLPTSPGALKTAGRRNTPTVLNADLHVAQFWDGRSKTLEEQATGPILNPIEMAMPDPAAVEARVRAGEVADRALFQAAFPGEREPFTIDYVARAIAAFERTLRTRDRFDDFMEGNAGALDAKEKEGLRLFLDTGCASCHGGPLLGGDKFQKLGIIHRYPNQKDRGRYEVTSDEIDEFVFKVPALRNVALTSPYFHDGAIPTLDAAVERMAWLQLGRKLTPGQRDAIVAFLRALSDADGAVGR
ncbi:MAG TPA: cytochrome c peroxidase [Thermoanaerobaculia bacterium]